MRREETVAPASRLIPVREDVDALQLAMLLIDAATASPPARPSGCCHEGTGDPTEVARLVRLVEEREAWSPSRPRPARLRLGDERHVDDG